ncbi:MAG: O-methyltransferase [Lachnospiraceae bacterium]|uniref:tRNA 5-hydroxyuridine methyltransferase n=1 Tax=Candidatus Weimeria bifida TaxID=2599074 RepID=A0A6N7IZW7_9FIRM|nr:O-methyltransferase [Candidatus Weimeria bifida]RRF96363.1 MAG: O-methyltransferase [Lachnospiraceae bacterium]
MIFEDYDRFQDFLRSYPFKLPDELYQIKKKALSDHVPVIRDDTQRFMAFLMKLISPERILEIGTAVGFSALLMANFDDDLKELVTIEDYEPRIREARANFRRFDAPVTFLAGDAADILENLDGKFDFVFIDAAKGQYPEYLRLVGPLLADKAVITADNILQDGRILEPKEALERRDRTIHKRIRAYLSDIMTDESFVSTVLPVGDGLAVSAYRRKNG